MTTPKELGDRPAYPDHTVRGAYGMTIRQRFAMAAPREEIAPILGINLNNPSDLLRATAKARFMWADAMLAEATKEPQP